MTLVSSMQLDLCATRGGGRLGFGAWSYTHLGIGQGASFGAERGGFVGGRFSVKVAHAARRGGFIEERELTCLVHVPESGRSSERE
jgi:hypothetical protein